MTNTFKVGDKVRFNGSKAAEFILGWRRANGCGTVHGGDEHIVTEVFPDSTRYARAEQGVPDLGTNIRVACNGMEAGGETWWAEAFEPVPQDVTGPATAPTAVSKLLAVKLYPQDKTILGHLEKGKSITPQKAMVVYGISRLAACIHNIRKAGYKVARTLCTDEVGHNYAEYRLG